MPKPPPSPPPQPPRENTQLGSKWQPKPINEVENFIDYPLLKEPLLIHKENDFAEVVRLLNWIFSTLWVIIILLVLGLLRAAFLE